MSSEDKIDDGLDNIDWHVNMVFYDGIIQLANNVESRNDYIFTDEITLKDKTIKLLRQEYKKIVLERNKLLQDVEALESVISGLQYDIKNQSKRK